MWYLLAAISLALVSQSPRTTLRLHVVDARGDGVALLRITAEDADGASHTVITDAAGQAVVGPLPGTIVFVRAAQFAQRQNLTVEPTTARQGLRLGLIPGQERRVRLIADGGLLFLDPKELFPAENPAGGAPDGASLPASALPVAAPPTPASLPSSAAVAEPIIAARPGAIASRRATAARTPPPAASSVGPFTARAPARARIVGLVAVAASTIVVLIGSIVVRRHP